MMWWVCQWQIIFFYKFFAIHLQGSQFLEDFVQSELSNLIGMYGYSE